MCLPPKQITIICLAATMCWLSADGASAQTASQYEARAAAMRAARVRAQQPSQLQNQIQQPPQVQRAPQAAASTQLQQVQYEQPVYDTASAGVMPAGATPMRRGRRFFPRHLRVSQLTQEPIADTGGADSVLENGMVTEQVAEGSPISGCQSGDCESCGNGVYRGMFGECSTCPPMAPGDCWISGFGSALKNGEYFAGAAAFRGPGFQVPQGTNAAVIDDANYGFYGGANFGIPLCRLSCGLLSGQLGIRTMQSNFDGSSQTPDNRDQLFVTAGIYRRVDYGLQVGVAVDVLHEEWFTETDLSQIRGDIGWVYGNGSVLGFRSATGLQGDTTRGILNGVAFSGLVNTTVDYYRFYYRHNCAIGGYSELAFGWTDDSHFVSSLDFDLQVTDCIGMQSGFAYYLGDDNAVAAVAPDNDAWNIYVGLVWRPQGRNWWRSYDRPMFDVADNGTLLIER